MEAVLGGIISALVAGAVAKASDVGGRVIADAYDGLKSLIINKLGGKSGAVQSVEDEPQSDLAQAHLAEAMANSKIADDAELAAKASALEAKLATLPGEGRDGGDIEVGNVRAKVNAVVERLVATGRIKLGDITAETGDARVSDLTAGIGPKKNS